MIVEVSMKSDTEKFEVNNWWAANPQFVVNALEAQLRAAQAIWPILRGFKIVAVPICAKCQAELTSENTEGREDGLYCDTCITVLADQSSTPATA